MGPRTIDGERDAETAQLEIKAELEGIRADMDSAQEIIERRSNGFMDGGKINDRAGSKGWDGEQPPPYSTVYSIS